MAALLILGIDPDYYRADPPFSIGTPEGDMLQDLKDAGPRALMEGRPAELDVYRLDRVSTMRSVVTRAALRAWCQRHGYFPSALFDGTKVLWTNEQVRERMVALLKQGWSGTRMKTEEGRRKLGGINIEQFEQVWKTIPDELKPRGGRPPGS